MANDPLTVACRHLAELQGIVEAKNAEIERLRLTDAERTTLQHYATNNTHQRGDILRGLLERLSPPAT